MFEKNTIKIISNVFIVASRFKKRIPEDPPHVTWLLRFRR